MSDRDDTLTESQISTDRETVREWADSTDARPVRRTGVTDEELVLLPEEEHSADHERIGWDEFFEALDRDDRVVAYRGTDSDRPLQVLDRGRAVSQSALSDDEVGEALMEGDTVTTEVTETTVVEETIVEHADIESELIESEPLSTEIVDAELSSREVTDCEVVGLDEHTTMHDEAMFTAGHRTDEELDVMVHVEEEWDVTRETVEQVAIESRVVDTDVETSEAVEEEAVQTRVDLGDIEQTILQSGIIDSDHDVEAIDTKSIHSGFVEDDAVITELVELKTIDEKMTLLREYSGTIDESETTDVTSVQTTVVESEMGEADEYDLGELDIDAYERDRGAATTTADDGTVRITPDEEDQGKTVVDQMGEAVGVVAEVQSGSLYVDPHPSITEKISAKLGWGEVDDDTYLLETEQIGEITDSKVHLRGGESEAHE